MKKMLAPIAFMLASAASLFLSFSVFRSAALGFILYYLLCCLAFPALDMLALRRIGLRQAIASVGLRRPSRGDLALGLGSGAGMAAIMLVALALFKDRMFGDGRIGLVLAQWGASGRNAVAVYVVMLAFNGAIEELFWRGYLYDSLKDLPRRFVALGVPAFFFGAQHVFVVSRLVADPALVAVILAGIFGAGAIWSYMRERSGSVLPCVLSHMLVTAGYMGALLFFGR